MRDIIFIGGVQRSGTTLLRNILNSHPDIEVGYECAFYKLLYSKYSKGITKDNVNDFLNDLYNVKRFNTWELDKEYLKKRILESKLPLSYRDVVLIITDTYRKSKTIIKPIIGIKNPNIIFHVDLILSLFPEAKIINIIRDPRSILASEKKKNKKQNNYSSPEHIWKTYRRYKRMMKLYKSEKYNNKVYHIFYKDLLTNPKNVTQHMCNWLKIEWSEDLVEYYKNDHNKLPEGEAWQHSLSVSPLNLKRLKAYEKELEFTEVNVIEFLLNSEINSLKFKYTSVKKNFKFWNLLFKSFFYGLKYRLKLV